MAIQLSINDAFCLADKSRDARLLTSSTRNRYRASSRPRPTDAARYYYKYFINEKAGENEMILVANFVEGDRAGRIVADYLLLYAWRTRQMSVDSAA